MNATHLIICNRAAVSGDWIHVVPKGELPNRAAGIVQVLDDTALDAILANIESERARLGEKWPGVYAGREHFIYNDDQDSAALAWFKKFEKRADGLWAHKDGLTPIGQQVIANSEYKFTSFVADRKDTAPVNGNKVRILAIDTIGFTNQANGRELLTPITNRNDFPGSREPGANQPNNQRTTTMKSIAQKLGLAPEASEEAILGELIKLQNRVTALEPLATENTTLKNRVTELDGEQCDQLLDLYQVKEEKARGTLKPMLGALKNRTDRVTALTNLGHKLPDAKKAGVKILNRGDARGGQEADETSGANEQELASKAEAAISDYKIRNRCTYSEARNTVRLQKPELFGLNPTAA